ncbi:MAG TPA: VIT family protein [Gemmatimonadaceae bacterium]|nr:VIT family protein [Gemmatimonadaceae bacterium]
MGTARHPEVHYTQRIGWLRAAVLGANDGIVSTASLVVGVAAAESGRSGILIAGAAGLAAGAMSMAAGEYVSVSSQADTEKADLERERIELHESPERELEELRSIYIERGLDAELAARVAEQLTERGALTTHAREELGILEVHTARPVQAALASAVTFAVGGALPLITAVVLPPERILAGVSVSTIIFLAALGSLAAKAGGAGRLRGAARVTFWGALAMGITALVGLMFGAVV